MAKWASRPCGECPCKAIKYSPKPWPPSYTEPRTTAKSTLHSWQCWETTCLSSVISKVTSPA
jgi:hypothetical protein